MSAYSSYKLSILLDLLHKQFGLRPEFCVNYWHVPDPSAYWQLIACGKCAKEVTDLYQSIDACDMKVGPDGNLMKKDLGQVAVPVPCGWKFNDTYAPDHGNDLRAFLDIGWDIESMKANGILVRADTVTYSVTIIEGEASKPKVTQINNMPVPAGVKINYHPSTQHVDLALRDLQRLLRDATLRTSPAKVD